MSVDQAKGRGGTYMYFFCLNRVRRGCFSRYVPIERVEDWICDHYASVELEPERIGGIRTHLLKELETERRRTAREVKRQEMRLSKLMMERKKLLDAYYAGAIPLDLFASEQERITRGVDEAHDVLMLRDNEFKQTEQTVTEAIELAADWGRAYSEASAPIRRRMNQALFKRFLVDVGGLARAEVTDEFATMLTGDLVRQFERELPEPALGYEPERAGLVFSAVGSIK